MGIFGSRSRVSFHGTRGKGVVDRFALKRQRFKLALLREVVFKLSIDGKGVRQSVGGSTLPGRGLPWRSTEGFFMVLA